MANDELVELAKQKAIAMAEREMRQAERALEDASEYDDADAMAMALKDLNRASVEHHRLEDVFNPPSQYTAREAAWLNQRPSILNDPAKFEAVRKSFSQLVAAGVPRDSEQLFSALSARHDPASDGVSGSNASDLTPDEAAKLCGLTADQYNVGVHELIRRKAAGQYK